MNQINPTSHKQQIKTDFNRRNSYDERTFYHYYGNRLVKLAPLKRGDRVLYLATGTGIVAVSVAEIVDREGYVLGVDISQGMLSKAQEKIEARQLKNIEFKEGDVEEFEFTEKSFDGIFCSLALIYLTNISAVLQKCHRWLKSGGFMAFNAWSEKAFYPAILYRSILRKHGVNVSEPNHPLGTQEKCVRALAAAGFKEIKIHEDVSGWYYYPSRETALSIWQSNSKNAFGYQVWDLPPEQLESCKAEFIAEFEKIESSQKGSWCDATAYFAIGLK
ncbi:class I SAM-dependent methyltransferase [Myxosarcina sp. GI1(2024)]